MKDMVSSEEGPGGQASKWKERSPKAESRGSLFPTSSAKLVALFSRNFLRDRHLLSLPENLSGRNGAVR